MSRKKADIKRTQKAEVITFSKQQWIARYLFLMGITLFVMLIMAFNNSPLVERIGENGGMYLLIGRNLVQGGTIYKDLFDHKGPLIFLMNALPQLFIKGPFGVWCVEVIFMMVSVSLIYKMAYRMLKNEAALLIPLQYLCLTSIFMQGGNYSEEFGNLFSIMSLYFFMQWEEHQEKGLAKWQAYMLGIGMSFVFFMKPNVIANIAVVVAFIGIVTLKHEPKKALSYSIYGILGILTITVPIVLYHLQQGVLGEMLNATFLHNLSYCKEGVQTASSSWYLDTGFKRWSFLLIGIASYAFIRCMIYKDYLYALLVASGSLTIIASIGISGRGLIYYLTMTTPMTALAAILILKHGTRDSKRFLKRRLKPVIFCTLLIIGWVGYSIGSPNTYISTMTEYKVDIKALGAYIPKEERNEVFGYDVPAAWFYVNGMMPCYHYFTMQSWMARTDPSIQTSINDFVMTTKPEWLITYYDKAKNNDFLYEEITKNYEEIANNSSGYLYRIKNSK